MLFSTAPAIGTPKCASSIGGVFGSMAATVSPGRHPAPGERRGEPARPRPERRVGRAHVAMDPGDALGIHVAGALDEADRGERRVVRRIAVEARSYGQFAGWATSLTSTPRAVGGVTIAKAGACENRAGGVVRARRASCQRLAGRLAARPRIGRPEDCPCAVVAAAAAVNILPELHGQAGDDMRGSYQEIYARSLQDPEGFWAEAAEALDWDRRWDRVLDDARPPFYRWFAGGRLNTCYNAVDRHVEAGRGDQLALIYDSPVTGSVRTLTYRAAAGPGRALRRRAAAPGRRPRRPRDHLHADGAGGGDRHARLRADRRDPFGGVRRLRRARAGGAHRRRHAEAVWSRPPAASSRAG